MRMFTLPIRWFAEVFSEAEPDGRRKASFSRIFGGYVVVRIVEMSHVAGKTDALLTLFYWLVGYQLLSKLSPGVLDVVRGYLAKNTDTTPK